VITPIEQGDCTAAPAEEQISTNMALHLTDILLHPTGACEPARSFAQFHSLTEGGT